MTGDVVKPLPASLHHPTLAFHQRREDKETSRGVNVGGGRVAGSESERGEEGRGLVLVKGLGWLRDERRHL